MVESSLWLMFQRKMQEGGVYLEVEVEFAWEEVNYLQILEVEGRVVWEEKMNRRRENHRCVVKFSERRVNLLLNDILEILEVDFLQ